MISQDNVVSVTDKHLSAELAGEAVILSLDKGVYYTLNPVGADVWDLLQVKPRTFGEVRDALVAMYDVSPEQCERELRTLLLSLKSEGLVDIR